MAMTPVKAEHHFQIKDRTEEGDRIEVGDYVNTENSVSFESRMKTEEKASQELQKHFFIGPERGPFIHPQRRGLMQDIKNDNNSTAEASAATIDRPRKKRISPSKKNRTERRRLARQQAIHSQPSRSSASEAAAQAMTSVSPHDQGGECKWCPGVVHGNRPCPDLEERGRLITTVIKCGGMQSQKCREALRMLLADRREDLPW